jgi:hypothetical protein
MSEERYGGVQAHDAALWLSYAPTNGPNAAPNILSQMLDQYFNCTIVASSLGYK